MEDLSPEDRISALVPTSQEAGNMLSSRDRAMSAPGSDPVTVLPGIREQADPKMTPVGPATDPGATTRNRYRPGTPGSGPTWARTGTAQHDQPR